VLDDEVIVTIYHPEKVEHMLIAHGDQWCINDTAYMNFRQMVRQTQWQDIILAKPLYERQMMAQQIRMKSEIIKNNIGEYQDIEISALLNIVKSIKIEYGININTVIHGHTHAGKHYEITENVSFNRFVLSSWENCMSHIQVHQDEVVLCKNII
jgi:UDP-2,3-diacylglucosamine hydrolase